MTQLHTLGKTGKNRTTIPLLYNVKQAFCMYHGLLQRECQNNIRDTTHQSRTRGPSSGSIARDVGSSSTNRSSDVMHFLPRLLRKTLQHERL